MLKNLLHEGTFTVFFVRQVLRYAEIVPDKKKNGFYFFVFFSSDMVLSSPVMVSFLFSLLLVQSEKKTLLVKEAHLYKWPVQVISRNRLGKVIFS